MTLLFFFGAAAFFFGAASMNPWLLAAGVISLAISIHVLDERQQEANREAAERLAQERMARGNGHPKGNVDLIVKSGGES